MLHKRILIVDDNIKNLQLTAKILKDEEYLISLAQDGKSALEQLKTQKPNLILLDIMMPEMDGYEVCKKIKEQERLRDIPIIFLTAKTQTEDLVTGFELGGIDYITKPFNRDELLVRVNTHLELYLAKRIIEEQKQELADTLKTRDQLYSVIAHDLKGPFSNFDLLLSLLNEGSMKAGSDEFAEIINLLSDSARGTMGLLEVLLTWTRSQTGRLAIIKEEIELEEIIYDAINLIKNQIKIKEIELIYEAKQISVFADKHIITTIVRNLLANALKYTPQEGEIRVETSETNNEIIIYVIDNGVGMPQDTIDMILKNNNQYLSMPGTSGEKGAGLGLAVVRDFLEYKNGKLDISSSPGKGSVFEVRFPK